MPKSVFIDGQAGTVGLCIRDRLSEKPGITVVDIPEHLRKNVDARLERLLQADIAVLCLPDAAATEVVQMLADLGDDGPKILDASTAHRVAPGWIYGFPELTPNQADEIRSATLVTNPGCYAIGSLALLRPLVDAGVIPVDFSITINAVSGYSGGGNPLIAEMEGGQAAAFKLYGLNLQHKHVPELEEYTGLQKRPIFVPSVGNYRQGMIVSIPLHLDLLPGRPTGDDLAEVLRQRYAADERVSFVSTKDDAGHTELEPEALNHTDGLELRVFAQQEYGHAVLVARLDNLGMGAAGTAVQNIELMMDGING